MGIEVGGAIGIPLYISQALGAAMYIVGFTEGWIAIFPDHSAFLVSTSILLLLLITSLISAKVAMKVQYLIMFLIVLSLFSFFMGRSEGSAEITTWGTFENAPFWVFFAIFLPAVTGIEAGATMSGDLRDPQKTILVGDFYDELKKSAQTDIHIFGFSTDMNIKMLRSIAESANGSCLFVRDSGAESALA